MLSFDRLKSGDESHPVLAQTIELQKNALIDKYNAVDFAVVKSQLMLCNERLRNIHALNEGDSFNLSNGTQLTVSSEDKTNYQTSFHDYMADLLLYDAIEKARVLLDAIDTARSKKPANAPSVSESESSAESESSVNDETEQALSSLEARAAYALLGTVPTIEKCLHGTELELPDDQRREYNLRALGEEAAEAIGHGWIDAGSTEALGVELRNVGWAALGFLAVMLVGAGLLLAIAASGGAGIVPIAAIAAYCGFGLTSAILAGTPLSVSAATMLAGSTVLAGGTLAGLGVAGAASYADSENQVAAAGRALHQSVLHQSVLQQRLFAIKPPVVDEDSNAQDASGSITPPNT